MWRESKDSIKCIDNHNNLCYSLTTLPPETMINLDDRYHSYLNGSKRLRIDGVDEKVVGYGWRDDGSDIIGYYVTTENFQLHYCKQGMFQCMKALRELAQPVTKSAVMDV